MTHIVVVGLGFGDEGKGSLVDYLVRRESAHTVVRFNGGAQAAHNVVLPDGTHHTFSQFGSGTFAGAETFLSLHMLVNPHFLEAERQHLVQVGVERPNHFLKVDGRSLVTTPFHVAANRLAELQRKRRHGSCGMGIGETVSYFLEHLHAAVFTNDLRPHNRGSLAKKLHRLQQRKALEFRDISPDLEAAEVELDILNDPRAVENCMDTIYATFAETYEVVDPSYWDHLLLTGKPLVFEGAQGALLDENLGFSPYNTWSTTTAANAFDLLGKHSARVIGVTRAYHTRHGAGPFPTEEPSLTFPDHNCRGQWQGDFRFGSLDLVLLKYARYFAGCTEVAVTCLDHLPVEAKKDLRLRVCLDYAGRQDDLTWEQRFFDHPHNPDDDALAQLVAGCEPVFIYANDRNEVVRHIGKALQLPVTILSEGPTFEDKRCL